MLDIDGLNLILGNYVGVGVNNPKKYSKEPVMAKRLGRDKTVMTSDSELDAFIVAMANKGGK